MLEAILILVGLAILLTQDSKPSTTRAAAPRQGRANCPPAVSHSSGSQQASLDGGQQMYDKLDRFIAKHIEPEVQRIGPGAQQTLGHFKRNLWDYIMLVKLRYPLPARLSSGVFKTQLTRLLERMDKESTKPSGRP